MGNSHGKAAISSDDVNLNHFRLLRVVGKGAFGKVRIVERKDSGLTYALKYIRKDEVVRSECVRNIIRERRMLEHLNHPFLCNLRYSFQDIEYLYIIVDLMNGGDLRFHISRKAFTEDAVCFWIAELGCALRYVHKQGIVHRDVKPDNVLLDSDGHVHLADFNVASDFTPSKPLTSKSGTLAYLAPEVYEGKGYSSEVDWWSLGVLFYECIYNKRPFDPGNHNHESLAKLIKKAEPKFPLTQPPISMSCLHAISSLLEKDRKLRIGAISFHSFTDNPFFRSIDFEALEQKEIEPVFKPSSEKTNFDATYDLEELLLEEAPLEARARRQKPREQLRDDATQQEIRAEELHRMIETMFEPFNYELLSEHRPSVPELSSFERNESGARTPTEHNNGSHHHSHHHHHNSSGNNNNNNNGNGNSNNNQNNHNTSRSEQRSVNDPNNLRVTTTRSRSNTPTRNSSPTPGSPLMPLPRSTIHSGDHGDGDIYDHTMHHPTSHPGVDSPPSFGRPSHRTPRSTNRQPSGAPSTGTNGRQASPSGSTLGHSQAESRVGAADERQASGPAVSGRPSGMLNFLTRKKGRDRSPKAKERGVLGKEGARVIISS